MKEALLLLTRWYFPKAVYHMRLPFARVYVYTRRIDNINQKEFILF